MLIRRLNKLNSLFELVHQFKLLSEHQVEGMELQIAAFFRLVQDFRQNRHDLLAFESNDFDRRFLEFNARVLVLEGELQVCVCARKECHARTRATTVCLCVSDSDTLVWVFLA